jgi:hypothetical protein
MGTARDCYRIWKYRGDDRVQTVAFVRGEAEAGRLVEEYNAGRTDEDKGSVISYWSEKVAQRLCTAGRIILVPPRKRRSR